MEQKTLLDYAESFHIPRENHPEPGYDSVSGEQIESVLNKLFDRYGRKLILYGGQVATPALLGFKKLRCLTTDIDLVILPEFLEEIIEGEEVKYNPENDYLFCYKDNIIVVLSFLHIHNWMIPGNFYEKSINIMNKGHELRLCSPEYLVMLKFRRNSLEMKEGHDFYGKDALDILNLFMAPYFRKDLREIDFNLLCQLLSEHVTPSREEWIKLFDHLGKYLHHFQQDIMNEVYRHYSGIRKLIEG
ncbi:MAG: hypothetical protein DRP87_15275 [Spirochaetes bacterium]|nr:MAG: hypothetical protein DRP87_15275 [Spirochaetota bacterium]